jgi:site-specific DNA-methyltransferase (adenine-specific)
MMNTDLHFASAKTTESSRDDWQTPRSFFDSYDATYGFDLDAAADETNHLCPLWLGPGGVHEDALSADWSSFFLDADLPVNVWMNPPYSLTKAFVAKAHAEARINTATTVCLVAARPDTRVFHQYVWDQLAERPRKGVSVNFIKGRIKFVDPTGRGRKDAAPFPSMVVIFRAGEVE